MRNETMTSGQEQQSASTFDSRPIWASLVLKQIDVASTHLSEQHKRLQQEIYTRLAARSALLNYSIGTAAGLSGIIAYVLPKGESGSLLVQTNIVSFAIISVICFLGAFCFLFFYMNFLSHCGYIYTASRQITEQFPSVYREIQAVSRRAGEEFGMPEHLFLKLPPEHIFSWEREITSTRNRVKFTDSKFEILGYIAFSVISFSLSILAFVGFLDLLLSRSGTVAMLISTISGSLFLLFFILYYMAFSRCNRTFKAVMDFRNGQFPPLAS